MVRSLLTDAAMLTGFSCLLTGVYLWLGVPAALILAGLGLMALGIRLAQTETNDELDKTTVTARPEVHAGDA